MNDVAQFGIAYVLMFAGLYVYADWLIHGLPWKKK